jgi:hypothetical protein
MTVKVAEAHVHIQRMVLVVKMVTVLEECIPKSSVLLCVFLWTRGLNAKDIRKEMFPVYGGKCLSCKAVHSWVANVLLMPEEVETEVRKWLRQQSKDFYAAGLDALVKRWDKCISV